MLCPDPLSTHCSPAYGLLVRVTIGHILFEGFVWSLSIPRPHTALETAFNPMTMVVVVVLSFLPPLPSREYKSEECRTLHPKSLQQDWGLVVLVTCSWDPVVFHSLFHFTSSSPVGEPVGYLLRDLGGTQIMSGIRIPLAGTAAH